MGAAGEGCDLVLAMETLVFATSSDAGRRGFLITTEHMALG